jgi:hypothetical protein
MAVRHEAKEVKIDVRPQAPKTRRRNHWNTVRIFRGREQSRCQPSRHSGKANVGRRLRLRPAHSALEEDVRAQINQEE